MLRYRNLFRQELSNRFFVVENKCLVIRMFTLRSIVLLMTWVCSGHNGSYCRRRKKNLRCRTTHVRANKCFKRKQEIETRTLTHHRLLVILCHTNTSSTNEDLVGKSFCSSSFQFSYRSSSVYKMRVQKISRLEVILMYHNI